MLLVGLLFMALIVAGVVLIVRTSSQGGGRRGGPESGDAFRILDERFARGEIDQAEYEERRRVLRGGG